jgi:Rrf2 family protein
MIYSLSIKYAIQACVHLAQVPGGANALVKQISKEEDIPAHFLAKILQQLARRGVLASTKGPAGGFSLRISADKIALMDVIVAIDGLSEYQKSVYGLTESPNAPPWGTHEGWKDMQARISDYFHQTTIADLAAAAVESKKNQLKILQSQEIAAGSATP